MEFAGQGLVPDFGMAGHVLPNAVVTDAHSIADYYRENVRARLGNDSLWRGHGPVGPPPC